MIISSKPSYFILSNQHNFMEEKKNKDANKRFQKLLKEHRKKIRKEKLEQDLEKIIDSYTTYYHTFLLIKEKEEEVFINSKSELLLKNLCKLEEEKTFRNLYVLYKLIEQINLYKP